MDTVSTSINMEKKAISYAYSKGWIDKDIELTDIVTVGEFTNIIKKIQRFSSYTDEDIYAGLNNIPSNNSPLTRELLAKVLVKVFKLPGVYPKDIKDLSQISNWAVEAVGLMLEEGYMAAEDGFFNPKGHITYAELLQVIFNSYPLKVAWDKLTGEGGFSMWHNMSNHALILDPDPHESPGDGVLYKQIGDIRGLMIVIDFDDARGEDNTGGNGNYALNGVDCLINAEDYYHFLYPDAAKFFHTISYGKVNFKMDLLKDPDTPTGAFRMGKSLYDNYAFDRGGDVITYLKDEVMIKRVQEVLASSKEYDKSYDILYVVAVENAKGISYGPMDLHGEYANAITSRSSFKALVRIGLDSYVKWKYKAMIHETTHALNIVDFYISSFSGPGGGQEDPITGKRDIFPYCGDFDYMGNIAAQGPDLFAWNKWRLGWIEDSQVDIINHKGTSTHILTPIEVEGGTKMVVIPGDIKGVAFIIEYRQRFGVDADTLLYPGILMYKIDCNVPSLHGPLVTVNLYPDLKGKGSLRDALNASTLGKASGIWEYYDEAAGVKVSIEDPSDERPESCKIKVEYNNKSNSVSPTLYHAKFINPSTIEFKTSHDLRGVSKDKIILTKDGKPVTGVAINQVLPRSMRISFDEENFKTRKDMESRVELTIDQFSFYGRSNTCQVSL